MTDRDSKQGANVNVIEHPGQKWGPHLRTVSTLDSPQLLQKLLYIAHGLLPLQKKDNIDSTY